MGDGGERDGGVGQATGASEKRESQCCSSRGGRGAFDGWFFNDSPLCSVCAREREKRERGCVYVRVGWWERDSTQPDHRVVPPASFCCKGHQTPFTRPMHPPLGVIAKLLPVQTSEVGWACEVFVSQCVTSKAGGGGHCITVHILLLLQ